jgi:hypothetical protein
MLYLTTGDPMVYRAVFWGLAGMALAFSLAFLEEANAQTSLTGINRDSVLQLNLGSGRSLPRVPVGGSGSEEGRDPAAPSAQMWAEWHIRANVCTGNLSTEELAELFPLVNQALVDAVCRGGS